MRRSPSPQLAHQVPALSDYSRERWVWRFGQYFQVLESKGDAIFGSSTAEYIGALIESNACKDLLQEAGIGDKYNTAKMYKVSSTAVFQVSFPIFLSVI